MVHWSVSIYYECKIPSGSPVRCRWSMMGINTTVAVTPINLQCTTFSTQTQRLPPPRHNASVAHTTIVYEYSWFDHTPALSALRLSLSCNNDEYFHAAITVTSTAHGQWPPIVVLKLSLDRVRLITTYLTAAPLALLPHVWRRPVTHKTTLQ